MQFEWDLMVHDRKQKMDEVEVALQKHKKTCPTHMREIKMNKEIKKS